MICNFMIQDTFLGTWAVLMGASELFLFTLSTSLFRWLYFNVTYDMWLLKTNPKFPSPQVVCDEFVGSFLGMILGCSPMAIALYLSAKQGSDRLEFYHGYCTGSDEDTYSIGSNILQALCLVFTLDFLLWGSHTLQHIVEPLWKVHRDHHMFPNPTPLGTSANDGLEIAVYACPVLVLPLFVPINMDIAFSVFLILFGVFTTYIHTGYEFRWHDAHHPILSSSYHHYQHHALSFMNRPLHCGALIKVWDQLSGQVYTGNCKCVSCRHRTPEQFENTIVPDYSILWKDASLVKHSLRSHIGVPAMKVVDAVAALRKKRALH
jgi:sterol desaturase/sphingolipid hydroxylase (fatty acid hydroxylase superfamily)